MTIGKVEAAIGILVIVVSVSTYFINLGYDVKLMKKSYENSVHMVGQLSAEVVNLKKDYQVLRSDSEQNYDSIVESNRIIVDIKEKLAMVAERTKISLQSLKDN